MSLVSVSSSISKQLLNEMHNPDEYMIFARRGLSRQVADGILQRYEGEITHVLNRTDLSIELEVRLHVFSPEELDAYVNARIAEALASHHAHAAQRGEATQRG